MLLEAHPDPFGIHLHTLTVPPKSPATLCPFIRIQEGTWLSHFEGKLEVLEPQETALN